MDIDLKGDTIACAQVPRKTPSVVKIPRITCEIQRKNQTTVKIRGQLDRVTVEQGYERKTIGFKTSSITADKDMTCHRSHHKSSIGGMESTWNCY